MPAFLLFCKRSFIPVNLRLYNAARNIKTSIRTKTRLSQIVQEGRFRGGFVPFGYRLEKGGRMNKKNREVYEIKVNDEEAAVVRTMFEKYINEGLGSLRICRYLDERGIKTRKGNDFTNTSIHTILTNIIYTGILRSGETRSEIFPELQIVSVDIFERAQEIMKQRSCNFKSDTHENSVPLSTKGKSLLSVNIFCGQCGARLTLNDNRKTYHKQDGSVTVTPRLRYVCYNRVRHPNQCDGKATHLVKKIDALVDQTIRMVFDRITERPRTDIIQSGIDEALTETDAAIRALTNGIPKMERELIDYKKEVLKIIRGESAFTAPLLNELISQTEDQIEKTKNEIIRLQESRANEADRITDLKKQYDTMMSWAQMYDESSFEAKKMIAAALIKSVKVFNGNRLVFDFNLGVEQFLSAEELSIRYSNDAGGRPTGRINENWLAVI